MFLPPGSGIQDRVCASLSGGVDGPHFQSDLVTGLRRNGERQLGCVGEGGVEGSEGLGWRRLEVGGVPRQCVGGSRWHSCCCLLGLKEVQESGDAIVSGKFPKLRVAER